MLVKVIVSKEEIFLANVHIVEVLPILVDWAPGSIVLVILRLHLLLLAFVVLQIGLLLVTTTPAMYEQFVMNYEQFM